jgi:Mn-dependent DtxR family transcriptional regulator
MLVFAAGHAIVSTLLGYWLSHNAVLNTSASGAICVAGFGLFLMSWLLSPKHGLVTQSVVRRRLRRTIAMENLLKAIAELERTAGARASDVQRDLAVGHKSFEATLRRAIDGGWVRREADALLLTPAGRARSERLARAHRLWEQFLQQEVGLPADHVHDAAEWIEHHLSDEKIGRLDEMLGGEPRAG